MVVAILAAGKLHALSSLVHQATDTLSAAPDVLGMVVVVVQMAVAWAYVSTLLRGMIDYCRQRDAINHCTVVETM
jgi:hypothetical protein